MPRRWNWDRFLSAWPLLASGYLKKMVIADNVAVYVDKIFMLRQPSGFLLACGTVAFAVQIYADFSGYTDIARGSARLLGFELMENFQSPVPGNLPLRLLAPLAHLLLLLDSRLPLYPSRRVARDGSVALRPGAPDHVRA